jgi:hypothetical protein
MDWEAVALMGRLQKSDVKDQVYKFIISLFRARMKEGASKPWILGKAVSGAFGLKPTAAEN